jgi:hypothetical protein
MPDANDTDRAFLIVSALALAAPTLIAARYQPYLYTVILGAATWASASYHIAGEDQYEYGFQDMFYANLLIMIIGFQSMLVWNKAINTKGWHIMVCQRRANALNTRRMSHGLAIPTTWRVWLPIAIGAVSVGFYMSKGRLVCNPDIETGCRPKHYNVYHIVWHFTSALATSILMLTRVDDHLVIFRRTYMQLWQQQDDAVEYTQLSQGKAARPATALDTIDDADDGV